MTDGQTDRHRFKKKKQNAPNLFAKGFRRTSFPRPGFQVEREHRLLLTGNGRLAKVSEAMPIGTEGGVDADVDATTFVQLEDGVEKRHVTADRRHREARA